MDGVDDVIEVLHPIQMMCFDPLQKLLQNKRASIALELFSLFRKYLS